ncbi:helix-turn-helix domain-containing protein, partial [Enterococcus faecium]|nr:helix-turn-helix domain-containing protein [Enterococcus faecium]
MYIDDTETIIIKIIQILDYEEKWWKTEELSQMLGISKSTVQKYIRDLKFHIEEDLKLVEQFQILAAASKGVILKRIGKVNIGIQSLVTKIYDHSLVYSIVEELLNENGETVISLSLKKYASVASIRRCFSKMNAYFSEHDLKIEKLCLNGPELNARSFFFSYYWEITRGIIWPFHSIRKETILKLITIIEDRFGFKYSLMAKEEMCFLFAISRIRYK